MDGIILDKCSRLPLVLLEYRKHTMLYPITSVKLYYKGRRDKRKYDRLFALAKALAIPIIVLTFPTRERHTEIQLELVRIVNEKFEVVKTVRCQIPNDEATVIVLKKFIYKLMQVWGKHAEGVAANSHFVTTPITVICSNYKGKWIHYCILT